MDGDVGCAVAPVDPVVTPGVAGGGDCVAAGEEQAEAASRTATSGANARIPAGLGPTMTSA